MADCTGGSTLSSTPCACRAARALLEGEEVRSRKFQSSCRAVTGDVKRLGGGHWRLEMRLALVLGSGNAFGLESGPECWGGRGAPPPPPLKRCPACSCLPWDRIALLCADSLGAARCVLRPTGWLGAGWLCARHSQARHCVPMPQWYACPFDHRIHRSASVDMANMQDDSLLWNECHSFWKGYKFYDAEKEQQFRARYLPHVLRICQVCYALSFVLDMTPLRRLDSVALAFFLLHVPSLLIDGGLLILLSCFTFARRHIALCVSAGCIVAMAYAGVLVHWKRDAIISNFTDNDLVEVMKEISGNAVAIDELESFLSARATRLVLDAQLLYMVPQMLLLVALGFEQSTLWSCVLQPIVFLGALLMSPDVRQQLFMVLS